MAAKANPDCDFMSWQKPSTEKCPKCGSYMVEKGNKLLCANETCGYRMDKPAGRAEINFFFLFSEKHEIFKKSIVIGQKLC